MGLSDHRQRVRALVQDQIPSEIPEEMSYLEDSLTDPVRVKFFAEYASDPQWLRWATRQRDFGTRRKLAASKASPPSAGTLMHWFAATYAFSSENYEGALSSMLELNRGQLNALVWDALGRSLHVNDAGSGSVVKKWLVLMCRDHPTDAQPWLEYQLDRCSWPKDADILYLLIAHLAHPLPTLQSGFFGGSRVEITLRGEEFWVRKAWDEQILPNIDSLATAFLGTFEQHLRLAVSYMVNGLTLESDSPFISRITVEPSEKNWHQDDLDFLIDGARECLESVVRNSPGSSGAGDGRVDSEWSRAAGASRSTWLAPTR